MSTDKKNTEAAEVLWQAERDARPCEPLHDYLDSGDLDAAYAVQQINIERRLKSGARLIGRKIGLTAASVQQQLGVDQPDYGTLLSDMIVSDGGSVPKIRLLQPKVEAEIAFVLGADLVMENPTAADVLRATAFIAPSIEIVDSRIADWKIALTDTIADNASSGLFVLGTPAISPLGFDFTACEMEMSIDGQQVSTGTGRDCLGSPVAAVAWLAEKMRAENMPLRAGYIIMSGALGPMVPAAPGADVHAKISGLGHVSVLFEE